MSEIIQYGVPRSGSTLIYNMLRLMYPYHKVIKTHEFKQEYAGKPFVNTFRDFKQTLVSHKRLTVLKKGKQFRGYLHMNTINSFIDYYEKHLKYSYQFNKNEHGLWLDYRQFSESPVSVVETIEEYLGNSRVNIDEVIELCSKDNVRAISEKLEDDQDEKTKIQPYHISPDSVHWQRYLKPETQGLYEQRMNIFNADLQRIIRGGL